MSGTAKKAQFASDNTVGMCPEVMEAYLKANRGDVPSYGNDSWTERAANLLRELFETDCEVFFVFNGTAANSLALASCCQSYHSVVCFEHAHICEDECGAPEFFSNGAKLMGVEGKHGKISPAAVEAFALKRSDLHFQKPRAVSLTQSTEFGTVYQTDELAALREVTKKFKLAAHMDGARFAYAVASLGVAPKRVSWEAGIDLLCFGGTKLGMAGSEAVIFFDRALAADFEYRCKQAAQLASKMRFLAAGWVGMLENGAWLKHAQHANRCARLLEKRLITEASLSPAHPVEANAVFVPLPENLAKGLRERGWEFHDFAGGGSRLMCSWQTSEADIDALMADVRVIQKA
ncbi:MAG TPA: low specificity L-threonine aldolase [Verrucomicrobiae bacterium]|jgi:threonine aldolase|nr:low specificity L-threonine aldolase [Verrucomicrobiae bacterium]